MIIIFIKDVDLEIVPNGDYSQSFNCHFSKQQTETVELIKLRDNDVDVRFTSGECYGLDRSCFDIDNLNKTEIDAFLENFDAIQSRVPFYTSLWKHWEQTKLY